ncbi:hypothetical protein D9M70_568650 [compost metagenome]
MGVELHRAICRNVGADIGAERFADLLRVLVADEAEGNLRRSLGRNHRLEAFAGIAAGDAVDFGGRARPGQFQHRTVLFARRDRQADFAEKLLRRLAERFPGSLDLGRGLFDAFVEAW